MSWRVDPQNKDLVYDGVELGIAPSPTKGTANLQNVKLVSAKYVNVYDVMNAHHIVLTADAVKAVEEWLKPVAKKEVK